MLNIPYLIQSSKYKATFQIIPIKMSPKLAYYTEVFIEMSSSHSKFVDVHSTLNSESDICDYVISI